MLVSHRQNLNTKMQPRPLYYKLVDLVAQATLPNRIYVANYDVSASDYSINYHRPRHHWVLMQDWTGNRRKHCDHDVVESPGRRVRRHVNISMHIIEYVLSLGFFPSLKWLQIPPTHSGWGMQQGALMLTAHSQHVHCFKKWTHIPSTLIAISIL